MRRQIKLFWCQILDFGRFQAKHTRGAEWRINRAFSALQRLPQAGLQRDLSNAGQGFRQWAVALHGCRDFLESRRVDSRYRSYHGQRDAVDDETVALLGETYAGRGIDLAGAVRDL